jgi:hypothetical protein
VARREEILLAWLRAVSQPHVLIRHWCEPARWLRFQATCTWRQRTPDDAWSRWAPTVAGRTRVTRISVRNIASNGITSLAFSHFWPWHTRALRMPRQPGKRKYVLEIKRKCRCNFAVHYLPPTSECFFLAIVNKEFDISSTIGATVSSKQSNYTTKHAQMAPLICSYK